MPVVTRAERENENWSLGTKIAAFIVLYFAATTCFIIFV